MHAYSYTLVSATSIGQAATTTTTGDIYLDGQVVDNSMNTTMPYYYNVADDNSSDALISTRVAADANCSSQVGLCSVIV